MAVTFTIGLSVGLDQSTQSFLTGLANNLQLEPQWAKDIMASLGRMEQQMATLAEQLTATKTELDAVKKDLDIIGPGVTDLQGQVTDLNKSIADLKAQLAASGVTSEIQAAADALAAEGADVQATADALAGKFPPKV